MPRPVIETAASFAYVETTIPAGMGSVANEPQPLPPTGRASAPGNNQL